MISIVRMALFAAVIVIPYFLGLSAEITTGLTWGILVGMFYEMLDNFIARRFE